MRYLVFLAIPIILSSCKYENKLIREYSLKGKYTVAPGETMVEFKCAKVRHLESGISHVVKLQKKHRLIFKKVTADILTLTYVKDFEDEEYIGMREDENSTISTLPYKVKVKGFVLHILRYQDEFLTYRILGEPRLLECPAVWFGGSSKKSKDKRGLAF